MSLALSLQALPADCGIAGKARRDPLFAESVQFLPHWFAYDSPAPARIGEKRQGATDPAWDWCCALAGRHAGLGARGCDLGVYWGALRFLLCPSWRAEPEGPDEASLSLLFGGGEAVAPDAVSTQGIPVRLLPLDRMADIARCLAARPSASLSAHLDVCAMTAAGVYKATEQPEWCEAVAARYASLRTFCGAAAARGDLAIACMV